MNALRSALVAFLVASATAAAAPLPVSPAGKHAIGQAAVAQRLRDLDARVSNLEPTGGWVQRCVERRAVQLPSGDYALLLAKRCWGS